MGNVVYHTQCPSCASQGRDNSCDNLAVYDDDSYHCFSCGYTKVSEDWIKEYGNSIKNKGDVLISNKDLEKFQEKSLSEDELKFIQETTVSRLNVKYRGLDNDVCEDIGIRWKVDEAGKPLEMYFPAKVKSDGEDKITGYKIRKLPKDFYSRGYVGKVNGFFGQTKTVAETLIIVAGEVDLITAIQSLKAVDKYHKSYNVVTSPLGEDSTSEIIKLNYDWVDSHSKIIVALDNDTAGEVAFEKVKAVVSNDKLFKANLRHKDLNDYLKNGDAEKLAQDLYWNATPVKNFGVVGSRQLLQGAKERLKQDKIPFPAFLSDLAQHFTDGAMWTGEWMNWISSVSSGKSTVMDAWMIDWALNSPYRQAIMSYESDWKSFGVKVASLATSKAVMKIEGKENRIKFIEENEDAILRLLQDENGADRFDFVDELPTSVEDAKKLVMYLVKVKGVRIIWIDPALDFLSICKNKSEYDDLIIFLDGVRMTHDVTIMMALHTRKNLSSGNNGSSGGEINEEDAYGGRELIAKGTINITAQRNKNADNLIEKNTMVLKIRKNRNDQVTGVEVKLFYRTKANKLYPYSYAANHNFFADDEFKTVEEVVTNDNVGFDLGHVSETGLDKFDNLAEDESKDDELRW